MGILANMVKIRIKYSCEEIKFIHFYLIFLLLIFFDTLLVFIYRLLNVIFIIIIMEIIKKMINNELNEIIYFINENYFIVKLKSYNIYLIKILS